MKRFRINPLWYVVIVSLLFSLNSGAFAQQNTTAVQTKEKTTVQQKPRLQVDTTKNKPPQKDAIDVKGEGKGSAQPTHYEHRVEKDQQGNAYGKNKGDLQGKEFGQERAEQARLNQETKSKELNETIIQGEEKVKEARERIRVAKEKLEQDKKEGRISDQVFQERKERISKAEQALSELEVSIEKGKAITPKSQ